METNREEQLHLRDYFGVFYRRKEIIIASILLLTPIGFIANRLQVPLYEAAAKILIEPGKMEIKRSAESIGIKDVAESGLADEDYYKAQYEIIASRQIIESAVRILGWDKKGDFEEAVTKVQNAVMVKPDKAGYRITNMARIVARYEIPEDAMKMSNAVTQAYISHMEDEKRSALKSTMDIYANQVFELKTKLQQSERTLQNFIEKEDVIVLGREDISKEALSEFKMELFNIKAERLEKEALLNELRNIPANDNLTTFAIISQNKESMNFVTVPLESELARKKWELNTLLAKYKEKYPKVIQLKNEIKEIEFQIVTEIKRTMQLLESNIASLNTREEELLSVLKAENPKLTQKEKEYLALKNDVDIQKDLYSSFLKSFSELDIRKEDETKPNITIIEPARLPKEPIKTQRLGYILSPLFGLLLGVGLALFLEYMDNSIRSLEDVEDYLKLPVLGVIPHIGIEVMKKRHKRREVKKVEIPKAHI